MLSAGKGECKRMKTMVWAVFLMIFACCASMTSAVAQDGTGSNFRRSIETLTRKLQKQPNDKQALVGRAYAYMEVGDYASSLKDFEAAEPPDASYETWFYAHKSSVNVFLKRYKEAVVDCDKGMKHASREPYAYLANTRAVALTELHDLPGALKSIDLALSVMPQLGPAWGTRAQIQYEMGQYAQAIVDANKAIQRMPVQGADVGECLYWRSCAERKLGQKAQADTDLQKSVQLGFKPGQMRFAADKNTAKIHD